MLFLRQIVFFLHYYTAPGKIIFSIDFSMIYKNIFEQAREGLIIFDNSGQIIDANSRSCFFFERDKETFKKNRLQNILGEEVYHNLLLSAKKDYDIAPYKLFVKKSKGSGFALEAIIKTFDDLLLLSLTDVTRKEKIVEDLKRNEQNFNLIENHLVDVVWMMDLDLKTNYISPSIINLTGFTPKEHINQALEERFTAQSACLIKRIFKEKLTLMKSGELPKDYVFTGEFDYKHKDGSIVHTEIKVSAIWDEGEIVGIQGISRDITVRKRNEEELENYKNHLEKLVDQRTEELKENEEKLRNIFNATNDGITISDMEGNFIEANKIALERTGYTKEEMYSSNVKDIVFKGSEKVKKKYLKKLNDKGTITFEAEYVNKNGKNISLEICSKIIDYKGNKAILHTTREISERKELERKIVKTIYETEEKERTRFSQELHDGMGAILSSIKMHLSLLKKARTDRLQKEEILTKTEDLIKTAITTARNISHNIRPPELAKFGLVPAIRAFTEKISTYTDIEINIQANHFNASFPDDVEHLLYRVINELVNNTLKHSNANNISIELVNNKKKAVIIYADDGIGFSPEKVLDTKNKGMGLNNIISRLNAINAKSELKSAPGSGMVFVIDIPG